MDFIESKFQLVQDILTICLYTKYSIILSIVLKVQPINRPLKNYLRCRYGVKNRLKMLIYYT